MSGRFTYPALFPRQSESVQVFTFCALAADVLRFATIDRISRRPDGKLNGFQRPQVANHIREIREYLSKSDAILPNSVVVAFTSGVELQVRANGIGSIDIDSRGKPGLVVDGQQRLSALAQLEQKGFEVFVTGMICESEEELRKQFILINNTKPLPKALIYELLPTVAGLPHRLSSRSLAAELIELLNYSDESSLKGQIKQHTNPSGVLQDTVMQKLIMSSLTDGVLREMIRRDDGLHACFRILSEFFASVQAVFPESWQGHKPRSSRLVHGVGIIGMGYVMEHICATEGATDAGQFEAHLKALKPYVAWTQGSWNLGEGNVRPWNSLQFVPRDYMGVAQYLVRVVRSNQRTLAGTIGNGRNSFHEVSSRTT